MTRYLHLFVCLVATLCMEGAFAQALPTQTYQSVQNSTSSSPVAYVYVSGQKTAGVNEIYAFAAASSGKLTRVSGSPFPGNIASMAVNGKYLFGSSDEQTDISSFSIAPDGALKQAASIDGRKYNGYACMTWISSATFALTTPINLSASRKPQASWTILEAMVRIRGSMFR
jgi:6-phosphogluconolactonase (cycloisomerase 2 family)